MPFRPNAVTPAPTSGAGSTRSELAALYEHIRVRIMAMGVVISIVVGFIVGWISGPYVQLAAAIVFVHSLYVRRSGRPPGSMTHVIDGAGIALVTLTISLPVVTATAFCFYIVVASILATPRNLKWIGLFTVSWIALSLVWMQNDQRAPYSVSARVLIEVATVTFFAAAITLVVAVLLARLRRAEAERTAAAEQLSATNAKLQELIASKDRFVASVSHELRTPLTTVLGMAEELSNANGGLSRHDLAEIHSLIAGEAGEVARIVEDLLVVARADIGEVAVFPESISLGDVCMETVRTTPDARDIAVTGSCRSFADPIRVKQILRNLLVNASRYGGESVRVVIRQGPDAGLVEVADNGAGIPDEAVGRIFEPYERADQAASTTNSIGLGLAVSRTLARLMGGDLDYQRRDGWSVFVLSLPLDHEAVRDTLARA